MLAIRGTTMLVLLLFFFLLPMRSSAFEFKFGNDQNGITGVSAAVLSGDGFQLHMAAGPNGSVFNESDQQGMGIDSRNAVGTDEDHTKFNLVAGSDVGERFSFSFEQSGWITGLNFDGVKDETLEYFLLESPGNTPTYFFDSQADPEAIEVEGNVVFLLEDETFDDEIVGLSIPFAASQEFSITYGQLLAGNGSRFEGITVEVPEPAAMLLLLMGLISGRRMLAG